MSHGSVPQPTRRSAGDENARPTNNSLLSPGFTQPSDDLATLPGSGAEHATTWEVARFA